MTSRLSQSSRHKPDHQAGVALLLCLLFLTALVLTGLNATAEAIMQNQLAGNLHAREQADQAAAEALEWAESWLQTLAIPAPASRTEMHQPEFLQSVESWPLEIEQQDTSWWLDNGHATGSYPDNVEASPSATHFDDENSLWLAQPLHWEPADMDGTHGVRVWYRVVSRGSNEPGSIVSVMESIMVRTWPTTEQASTSDINVSDWCDSNIGSCGREAWRKLR